MPPGGFFERPPVGPASRSVKPAFMMLRIKFLAPVLTLSCLSAAAQKINKYDKITLANLQAHIRYLSDDRLEGRSTGSTGEKAASDYIIAEFSKAGAQPKGDNNGWLQSFVIDQGRGITTDTYLSVNDRALLLNREYFPLALSPAGQVSGSPAIALQESGLPWFLDLRELMEANAGNTHFDLPGAIRTKAAACSKKGATALLVYNSSLKYPDKLIFDPRDKPEPAVIPVVYITREAKRKYLKDESASIDIRLKIGFEEKQKTGHNVVAYIDNGAQSTVIVGAHYDHLGFRTDSSQIAGPASSATAPAPATVGHVIFHGANDNASGVAAMIELARLLKESKFRNNNYLFIAFSGTEMGWSGSGWFADHAVTDLKKVNCMLDLEMIGRLNDTTHAVTIAGYGTSPAWPQICGNALRDKKSLSLLVDSSAARPGDYTAFYRKSIPVLFFSTGYYSDYHQPGDKDDKINYPGELQVLKFIYSIIENVNDRGKVWFTPARDISANLP
jgi:aminopeptidase YwaD